MESEEEDIKDRLQREVCHASNQWRESTRNYVKTIGMDDWIRDFILMHISQNADFTWISLNKIKSY